MKELIAELEAVIAKYKNKEEVEEAVQTTSQKGIDLIKEFEGFEPKAYKDPIGIWTIGYGHTKGVKPHHVLTKEAAEALLATDLKSREKAVRELINVPLTQGQFDALVSFVYNVGAGRLKTSTLRKRLNKGEYKRASKELDKWVYAGGRKFKGLQRRRAAERKLFDA